MVGHVQSGWRLGLFMVVFAFPGIALGLGPAPDCSVLAVGGRTVTS